MATPIPTNRASFTAAEIALVTDGRLVRGDPSTVAIGVRTDSRAVESANLFVALVGESSDGHRFIGGAVDRGAAIVVVAKSSAIRGDLSACVIVVDDTLVALGRLARAHRDRWAHGREVGVVAITGSAGKTTTKELTAAVARGVFGAESVLATSGNLNNRIGVPMTLLGLEARHRVAVVECGTSIRGEIAALAEICAPDVAIVTHVGVAHAEGLMADGESPHEAVAREKGALIAAARVRAIVCGDDPWASATLLRSKARTRAKFGRGAACDYRVVDVSLEENGTLVTIERCDNGRWSIDLPLFGEAAAVDLAAAFAAVDGLLGRSLESGDSTRINAALAAHVRPVAGRLAPRRRKDGLLVLDDTYNASPSAFEASLITARHLADRTARRLVVVAGEMRELGSVATEAHDAVGAAIVRAAPALLVTTGGLAERYADVASATFETQRCVDARSASEAVLKRIGERDLVFVKASRGVGLEVVVDAILAHAVGGAEDASSLMQLHPAAHDSAASERGGG